MSSTMEGIRSIVRTLHHEAHAEFDCDAGEDDATEDHDAEMAVAGQIIMDLRRDGLDVYKRRTARRPTMEPGP